MSSIFTFDLAHLLARYFGTTPLAVGLPSNYFGDVVLFDPSRGDDPWVNFSQVIVPTSEHRYTYDNRHQTVYMSGFWTLFSFASENDLIAEVVARTLHYSPMVGVPEPRAEVLSKTMDRIRFLFEVTNVDFAKFPVEIRGDGESAFLWHPDALTSVRFTRVRDSFPVVPGEPRFAGTNELARNLVEFLVYESGCFGKPGKSVRFESERTIR